MRRNNADPIVVFSTSPRREELERLLGSRAREVATVAGGVADLDAVVAATRGNQVSEIDHLASFLRECAAFVQSRIPTAQFTYEPGKRKFYHNVDATLIEREMGYTTAWSMEAQFARLIELLRGNLTFAARLASLGA